VRSSFYLRLSADDFSRATARSQPDGTILICDPDSDERESILPDIGIITLEDAETGDQIEINAADRQVRDSLPSSQSAANGNLCGYCGKTGLIGIDCHYGDD